MRTHVCSKYCSLTILQCYSPTNEADPEVKGDRYKKLQFVVSQVPQHDLPIIVGELNAIVGAGNINNKRIMGTHECDVMNIS